MENKESSAFNDSFLPVPVSISGNDWNSSLLEATISSCKFFELSTMIKKYQELKESQSTKPQHDNNLEGQCYQTIPFWHMFKEMVLLGNNVNILIQHLSLWKINVSSFFTTHFIFLCYTYYIKATLVQTK